MLSTISKRARSPVLPLSLALFTVCAIPAHAGPPRQATGPSVSEFLTPDGRFDLVAARNSRHEGPLDLAGFESHFDAETGELLFSPKSSPRSPDDVNWSSDFFVSGTSGPVLALAVYDGDLIMGGGFKQAGTVMVRNIARWDGTSWDSLGCGVYYPESSDFDPRVYALTVYDGRLIAGGHFIRAGDVNTTGIAAWDGESWYSLASGVDGDVLSLQVYEGTLIAGGNFPNAGGVPVGRIASWNGVSWQPLGAGVNQRVWCMTELDSLLVVGGEFTMAGADSANRIAAWDGTSWYSLGSGVDGTVLALCIFEGSLVAAGSFGNAGGTPANHIARWQDEQWEPIGSGLDGRVQAVATYDGSLFALGEFETAGGDSVNYAARWNGSSWESLDSGLDLDRGMFTTHVRMALTLWNGELIAGGGFNEASGVPAISVARWDGATWRSLDPLGMAISALWGTTYALRAWNGHLVAGGSFSYAGNTPANNIAAWDGSTWSPLGSGTDGTVHSLAVYNGDLIAGGLFEAAGETTVNNIARWDGSDWHALGSGTYHSHPPYQIVRTLIEYDGALIAGGDFIAAGGVPNTSSIARWDGSSWHSMGTTPVGPRVWDLEIYNERLYVGGSFENADTSYVAWWDGTSWGPLGGEIWYPDDWARDVYCLGVHNGKLVVGGVFTHVCQAGDTLCSDALLVNGIASWDGSSWSGLATGIDNPPCCFYPAVVHAFAIYNGDLIAGGNFRTAGGSDANCIARWDGSEWNPLGSGVWGIQWMSFYWTRVQTLEVFDDGLFAGGDFTSAGNKPSMHIARWDDPYTSASVTDPAQAIFQLEPNYPNPFNPSTTIRYSVKETAPVSLAIYDVTGRRVTTLVDEIRESGDHSVNWSGMDDGGSRVAAGVYFARLECGGEVRTTKVVLAK